MKTISRISISVIFVGMASLIIVMSVMSGFNKTIKDKLVLNKPHIVVTENSIQGLHKEIEKLPQVERADLVSQMDVVIRTQEGGFGGAMAKGISVDALKDYFTRMDQGKLGDNLPLNHLKVAAEMKSDEVILGLGLARNLDVYEGDNIVVIPPEALLMASGEIPFYEKVKVVAIIQSELPELDNQLMFFNFDSGLKALSKSPAQSRSVEIRLKDLTEQKSVVDYLDARGLSYETWQDRDSAILFALKMEKLMISIFIGLATFITSFSIVSVLSLLINQKRRDIGMLMAMGLSKDRLRWMFMGMGFVLAAIGTIGGVGFGLASSYTIKSMSLDILPDIYHDTSIPVVIDMQLVTWAFLGGILVALFGSLIPVLVSLRFTPTEAIRG